MTTIKSGYLLKKGKKTLFRQKWRKRFLVFKSNGELEYYTDNSKEQFLHSLNMNLVNEIKSKKFSESKFGFLLIFGKRTYYFSSENVTISENWMKCFQNFRNKKNNPDKKDCDKDENQQKLAKISNDIKNEIYQKMRQKMNYQNLKLNQDEISDHSRNKQNIIKETHNNHKSGNKNLKKNHNLLNSQVISELRLKNQKNIDLYETQEEKHNDKEKEKNKNENKKSTVLHNEQSGIESKYNIRINENLNENKKKNIIEKEHNVNMKKDEKIKENNNEKEKEKEFDLEKENKFDFEVKNENKDNNFSSLFYTEHLNENKNNDLDEFFQILREEKKKKDLENSIYNTTNTTNLPESFSKNTIKKINELRNTKNIEKGNENMISKSNNNNDNNNNDNNNKNNNNTKTFTDIDYDNSEKNDVYNENKNEDNNISYNKNMNQNEIKKEHLNKTKEKNIINKAGNKNAIKKKNSMINLKIDKPILENILKLSTEELLEQIKTPKTDQEKIFDFNIKKENNNPIGTIDDITSMLERKSSKIIKKPEQTTVNLNNNTIKQIEKKPKIGDQINQIMGKKNNSITDHQDFFTKNNNKLNLSESIDLLLQKKTNNFKTKTLGNSHQTSDKSQFTRLNNIDTLLLQTRNRRKTDEKTKNIHIMNRNNKMTKKPLFLTKSIPNEKSKSKLNVDELLNILKTKTKGVEFGGYINKKPLYNNDKNKDSPKKLLRVGGHYNKLNNDNSINENYDSNNHHVIGINNDSNNNNNNNNNLKNDDNKSNRLKNLQSQKKTYKNKISEYENISKEIDNILFAEPPLTSFSTLFQDQNNENSYSKQFDKEFDKKISQILNIPFQNKEKKKLNYTNDLSSDNSKANNIN
ncbi:plekhh protein [Anaeramoeba flamelloides]|uniref:Plekhh protein n=1 Tax=Anaeramoeba flamelloides TaxID=1746091 RepID=A0AAV8A0Z9_9EUKA|nr:plekhh protein [Anaeramoeba flamelloides]